MSGKTGRYLTVKSPVMSFCGDDPEELRQLCASIKAQTGATYKYELGVASLEGAVGISRQRLNKIAKALGIELLSVSKD